MSQIDKSYVTFFVDISLDEYYNINLVMCHYDLIPKLAKMVCLVVLV